MGVVGLEAGGEVDAEEERGMRAWELAEEATDGRHHDSLRFADILDNGQYRRRDWNKSHVKPMQRDGQRDQGI